MHFGLYVPLFGDYADARGLAALARDAEKAGWEGFFLWDHVFTDWPDRLVDPWVALTAIALNTERIRLGTLVTPLPRRRPWKLARETVSIDHVSNGRLTVDRRYQSLAFWVAGERGLAPGSHARPDSHGSAGG